MNNPISFLGLKDTKNGDYELLFSAQSEYSPAAFLKALAKAKNLEFDEDVYNQRKDDRLEYNCRRNLSQNARFVFNEQEDRKNIELRKIGFHFFEKKGRNTFLSIQGIFDPVVESPEFNCKMWFNDRNLELAEKIAEEFMENGDELIKIYGTMIKRLTRHCEEDIEYNRPNVA